MYAHTIPVITERRFSSGLTQRNIINITDIIQRRNASESVEVRNECRVRQLYILVRKNKLLLLN